VTHGLRSNVFDRLPHNLAHVPKAARMADMSCGMPTACGEQRPFQRAAARGCYSGEHETTMMRGVSCPNGLTCPTGFHTVARNRGAPLAPPLMCARIYVGTVGTVGPGLVLCCIVVPTQGCPIRRSCPSRRRRRQQLRGACQSAPGLRTCGLRRVGGRFGSSQSCLCSGG